MPIEFGELPPTTRGRTALPPITADDEKELTDNPGKWAVVVRDVQTAQNYTAWAKSKNNKEEGPWYVVTRGHRNKDGELHIEETTVKTGDNKGKKREIRYVDVWVCYSPEGKPKELLS